MLFDFIIFPISYYPYNPQFFFHIFLIMMVQTLPFMEYFPIKLQEALHSLSFAQVIVYDL